MSNNFPTRNSPNLLRSSVDADQSIGYGNMSASALNQFSGFRHEGNSAFQSFSSIQSPIRIGNDFLEEPRPTFSPGPILPVESLRRTPGPKSGSGFGTTPGPRSVRTKYLYLFVLFVSCFMFYAPFFVMFHIIRLTCVL